MYGVSNLNEESEMKNEAIWDARNCETDFVRRPAVRFQTFEVMSLTNFFKTARAPLHQPFPSLHPPRVVVSFEVGSHDRTSRSPKIGTKPTRQDAEGFG